MQLKKYFNLSDVTISLILPTFWIVLTLWISSLESMCDPVPNIEKCIEGLKLTPIIIGIPFAIGFFFAGIYLNSLLDKAEQQTEFPKGASQ